MQKLINSKFGLLFIFRHPLLKHYFVNYILAYPHISTHLGLPTCW